MPQITQKQKDDCQIIIEKEIPKFIELNKHELLNSLFRLVDGDLFYMETHLRNCREAFNECEVLSDDSIRSNVLAALVDNADTFIKDHTVLDDIKFEENYIERCITIQPWLIDVVVLIKTYKRMCYDLDQKLLTAAYIDDDNHIKYTSTLLAECHDLTVERFIKLFFSQFMLASTVIKPESNIVEDKIISVLVNAATYKPALIDTVISSAQFKDVAKDIKEALK